MERYKASTVKEGIVVHGNSLSFPIRKGMYIVFDKDFSSFRIDNFDNYKIEKDFKNIESPKIIHIFEKVNDISDGDYIDIYYDEYEFFGYQNILEKSGNFYKNQTFSPDWNFESRNLKTVLYIENINEDDIDLRVEEKGLYTSPPDQDVVFIANNGAKIKLDHFYRRSNVKNYQSNIIKNVIYENKFTILELTNNLPENVKQGKIITNKLLINVNKDLSDLEKINEFFYIVNSQLPYLNLPFPDIEDEVAARMLEDILLTIDKKFHDIDFNLNKINQKLG